MDTLGTMTDTESIALWSTVALQVGTLAKQLVERYFDQKAAVLKRQWEVADRVQFNRKLVATQEMVEKHNVTMVQKIDENTEITKAAVVVCQVAAVGAEKAYKEANDMNEKLARMGRGLNNG